MESFLIYLLKASALLGIFYLSYFFLLKRETSFQLNRKYLLAGIATSAILPAIYFTKKVYIQASTQSLQFITSPTNFSNTPAENPVDWWQIAGVAYLIISGFFIFRLGLQLFTVLKLLLSYDFQKRSGLKYLETDQNQLPFSFFNYIVFNPSRHSAKDLKLILEHEKVHARQLHSADILLANLATCILWFNPFTWLYKNAIEQNLEFIADRETVTHKAEIKEYQHALVKVSIAELRPALTNHFYQSFIKKRILMLNKKSSTQSPAWKLSLVMPLILAFMLLFNVNTEAQVVPQEEPQETPEYSEEPEVEEEIVVNEEVETSEEPEVTEEVEVEIHEAPEVSWTASATFHRNAFDELGKDPLYILNGERFKASKLKNKYIGLASRIEVLMGDQAIDRYGKDAENGVIIISEAEIIRNFNKEMKNIKNRDRFSGKYMMVQDNGKPNFINLNTGKNSVSPHAKTYAPGYGSSRAVVVDHDKVITYSKATPHPSKTYVIRKDAKHSGNGKMHYEFKAGDSRTMEFVSAGDAPGTARHSRVKVISQNGEPLYVVDGEVKPETFDIKVIEPENIEYINVLKGDKALKEYGKEGKDGVIKIRTKKFPAVSNSTVFLIKNSLSDEQLDALKTEVKDKTGYTLELKNIERNEEAIITNIEVKFHKENRMVYSKYSDTSGVPTIQVGLKENGGLIISASN